MRADRRHPKIAAASKRFVALARVSSREQEREGFSLDVQVEALNRYAERQGGAIVKLIRVAETASKADERKVFREMIEYARAGARDLDGILVYKIDRAARNLFDYVELERLESLHGVPLIAVSQPTENTPAGRMHRRVLASMASFYTEQQSLDVTEGLARRARSGLFVGMSPYGYRNRRVDGRSVVIVDEQAARNVKLVFELYAYQNCTIDMIVRRLAGQGVPYLPTCAAWPRSKVHAILRDRSYIGELRYRGQWLPGTHRPIVDRPTWNRVQALLGEKVYKSHELLYAGGMIRCGHCGNLITGERVRKPDGRQYVYYRCTTYNSPGHPRQRLAQRTLDEQVLGLFQRIRQPDQVREWFGRTLGSWAQDQQQVSRAEAGELQRQLSSLREQEDRLLNLRLLEQVDADTFARKQTELRDRIADLTLRLESADRGRQEHADLAIRAFELSQALADKWLVADYAARRKLIEIVLLNCTMKDGTLVVQMRKPFDLLAEGLLVSSSRGDWI